MEELRSTEILDKEIEIDAQKKAAKLVENANKEAQKILDGIDERVKESLEEQLLIHNSRIVQLQKTAEAYVPLEKERFLVSFYDNKVNQALNQYFNSLGKEKRLSVLSKKLLSCKSALENKKLHITCFGGIEEKDARKMVESILGKNVTDVKVISFDNSGEEAAAGNEIHEGMFIEIDDKLVKVRLTFDELIREIKDKYSRELAETLFNGVLPQ